jgi:type III secretory pathway component EscS
MTAITTRPVILHAIGLMVTFLSAVGGIFPGILFGLALIGVSDVILLMEDWYGRRNQNA